MKENNNKRKQKEGEKSKKEHREKVEVEEMRKIPFELEAHSKACTDWCISLKAFI